VDSKNPLDMTSIRGKVVEIIPDYEYKHADFLTKKYLGKEKYPFKRPDEKRIILKIVPEKIFVLPHLPMNEE
ncbi:MAG: PPOX class F420-dependent oxidoreductase, partial [Candidatus Nitrosopelagicus sp.]|nr:PPOX class F420-dependent oxidoreductase [Candidatus Nitrosopelagicus sp.]